MRTMVRGVVAVLLVAGAALNTPAEFPVIIVPTNSPSIQRWMCQRVTVSVITNTHIAVVADLRPQATRHPAPQLTMYFARDFLDLVDHAAIATMSSVVIPIRRVPLTWQDVWQETVATYPGGTPSGTARAIIPVTKFYDEIIMRMSKVTRTVRTHESTVVPPRPPGAYTVDVRVQHFDTSLAEATGPLRTDGPTGARLTVGLVDGFVGITFSLEGCTAYLRHGVTRYYIVGGNNDALALGTHTHYRVSRTPTGVKEQISWHLMPGDVHRLRHLLYGNRVQFTGLTDGKVCLSGRISTAARLALITTLRTHMDYVLRKETNNE